MSKELSGGPPRLGLGTGRTGSTWGVADLSRCVGCSGASLEIENQPFYANLVAIDLAERGKSRPYNFWLSRFAVALIGIVALFGFVRNTTRVLRGLSAVHRLNAVLLAERQTEPWRRP